MSEQKPLAWMDEAFKHLGIKEIKGPKTHPEIAKMLVEVKAGWTGDETPWCAIFASAVLKRTGRSYPTKSPGWALSHRTNGVILKKPAYGAVATKKRNGGGHVTFVAGITETGMIVGLGGNQSDSVNLALFKPSELTYTWPALANGTKTVPTEERYDLSVYDSKTLKVSVKED